MLPTSSSSPQPNDPNTETIHYQYNKIDWSGRNLDDKQLKTELAALVQLPELTHLDLSRNKLANRSFKIVALQLGPGGKFPNLRHLNLRNNLFYSSTDPLDKPTFRDFSRFIEALNSASLHTLILSNNRMHFSIEGLIADLLRSNQTIETLDLSGNRLTGKLLGEALYNNNINGGNLRTLILRNISFSPSTAKIIFLNVLANPKIKSLDLGLNRLVRTYSPSENGWVNFITSPKKVKRYVTGQQPAPFFDEPVVTAFGENTSLTDLRLNSTNLGPRDAAGLAAVISQNSTIRSLQLRSNLVRDEGGDHLMHALASPSCSVVRFHAPFNQLGHLTMRGLIEVIWQNNVLRDLDLRGNPLNRKLGKDLVNALRHNPSLMTLDENFLDSEDRNAVELILRRNYLNRNMRNLSLRKLLLEHLPEFLD